MQMDPLRPSPLMNSPLIRQRRHRVPDSGNQALAPAHGHCCLAACSFDWGTDVGGEGGAGIGIYDGGCGVGGGMRSGECVCLIFRIMFVSILIFKFTSRNSNLNIQANPTTSSHLHLHLRKPLLIEIDLAALARDEQEFDALDAAGLVENTLQDGQRERCACGGGDQD
jgi:hypothetical protein